MSFWPTSSDLTIDDSLVFCLSMALGLVEFYFKQDPKCGIVDRLFTLLL